MVDVEFIYKDRITIIKANEDEKMEDIFKRFINKVGIDKNTIFYIYSGNNINNEFKYKEIINEHDKKRNKMNILVYDINNNNIIKDTNINSFEIICPYCLVDSKININDYKISLDCRNRHKINKINFNEFENIQKIDISKIKCEVCKKYNKSNIYNHIFYRCNKCKINLCPLCQLNHDKNHNIINYEQINYICS